jgi:hypothetical protein
MKPSKQASEIADLKAQLREESQRAIYLQIIVDGLRSERARTTQKIDTLEECRLVLRGMLPVFTRLIETYEPDNTDAEWTVHARETLLRR